MAKGIIPRIKEFIITNLREDFPEIDGIGTDNKGFVIYTKAPLTSNQQAAIRQRVAEEFFNFQNIGRIKALD